NPSGRRRGVSPARRLRSSKCPWRSILMTACAMMTTERRPWRCTSELLPYQQEAVAKLLPSKVGALFMDMGTGKTRTAIEFVRLRQHKIDRVVWFCPVSLKETIRVEILKHTTRSEEHTSELQSRENLVCRLLLEKKK